MADTCTFGGYPEYEVSVSNVAQARLGITFLRNADIRLIDQKHQIWLPGKFI